MKIGNSIKSIRKKRGFRQVDLANLCGISQNYLSQIEKNIKEPNFSTLKLIADKLDTPLLVILFLSIEEDDVKQEKRDVYKTLEPTIKTLVTSFLE